jgi:hypothetical protein
MARNYCYLAICHARIFWTASRPTYVNDQSTGTLSRESSTVGTTYSIYLPSNLRNVYNKKKRRRDAHIHTVLLF